MSKTTSIINNGENLVLEEFKTIDSKKSLEDLKDIENEENPINDTTKNSQETSRKQSIEIPVKEKEISLEEKFKRRKTAGDLLFEQLTMKVTENVLELPNLCDSKHLLERNTLSFKCLAQLLLSSSSLNKNRLFLFPPLEDPGIKLAFDFQEPEPIRDDIGAEKYKQLCQEMEIVPISRIIKCLETDTLDLKYYGLTNKQIRALTEALKINSHVQTLILQDNWLTVEMTQMLSDMLVESTVLQYLSLRECRIGLEGAQRLGEILSSLQALKYMDLSFNELGDEGLLALKDGLCENTSIKKLNLSHNQITEDSGECLETILMENKFIEELDLSWSGFFTGQGNRKLFKGLLVSDRLKVLNLAWNGIGIVPAVKPITRYLRNSKNLEELDLSNNRLMGKSLRMIRTGINNNHSLKVVKLGNNIYTPDEAHFLLTMLAGKSKDPLHHLDMANMYIKKDSKPILKKIQNIRKTVKIGGILSDYEVYGPDTKKLIYERCKYLLLKPKRPKAKKDFGHFILSLPDNPISIEDFKKILKKKKIKKLDKDLVQTLMNLFMNKKHQIDCPNLIRDYMTYYPDTQLPPPKPKKSKKKKRKKRKAKQKIEKLIQVQDLENAEQKILPDQHPDEEPSNVNQSQSKNLNIENGN